MFFEDLRSERRLMEVAADRLSLRWYLGYDLFEPLPDHSSLTRIRDRYGLEVFRRFFEQIVERCAEAGLVWGEELYFDVTKVEANASLESITPRFAVEQHLQDLFEEDSQEPALDTYGAARTTDGDLDHLPYFNDEELITANAARSDWISKAGRQDRGVKGNFYRRKADLFLSKTDPDASPMKRKGADHSHLGYQAHCVVDGGKARSEPGRPGRPLRGHREQAHVGHVVEGHLQVEDMASSGNRRLGLRHRGEHSSHREDGH